LNNFRANGFIPDSSVQPNSAPDATVSLLRRLDAGLPASTALIARLGNGGAAGLPVVRAEFRNGVSGGASLLRAAYVTTTGAFSDKPLTNNTTYW